MDFTNTIQAMQSMGFDVVRKGKRILKKKKKRTKSAGLEKGFNYNVNKSKTGVELEFVFGKAKKYWQFVDEGVRGKGGFKGSGKARGRGSDFKFKYESPGGDLVKAIKKWIKNKPLRLRGSDGKFKPKTAQNINSSAWAIGYGIKRRGLERTQFFSKPFKEEVDENVIATAFSKDLESELDIMLKDINIEIIVKEK
jgi:hypothetical protein